MPRSTRFQPNIPPTSRLHVQAVSRTSPSLSLSTLWKLLVALCCALAAASAHATVVSWDLNLLNQNQSLNSSSHTFTSNGASITAYGFDRVAGTDPGHTLYYKNAGGDHGLGLVGTPHNELQVNSNGGPAQYIQFDLASILSMGFSNGQIKISSVDPGEAFDLYGSNTLGSLGSKISITGGYDSSFNDRFLDIPRFGDFQFVSIGAKVDDMLPWAIQATITPVPEMSTLFPIVGVLVGIASTQILRRRQMARMNGARVNDRSV